MILLKLVFWLAMALDAAVLLLFFVLGLAAAGPSHTSPISVFLLMLLAPGLVLGGLGFLFIRTQSTALQLVALTLVLSPILLVMAGIGMQEMQKLLHPEAEQRQVAFQPVSLKEVQDAVLRNDVEGVKKAAAAANIGQHLGGAGVIHMSLLRLQKSPEQLPVLKALLDAGANPNRGDADAPLKIAIQCSPKAGIEPVRLLLDAGADPNALDKLGVPVYMAAMDKKEVLQLLIDRGAKVDTKR